MPFLEQICWAFNTVPSRLNLLFWQYSFADISFKLRVAASQSVVEYNQQYQILAKVVSQALGGGKLNKPSAPEPTNVTELQALFNNVF